MLHCVSVFCLGLTDGDICHLSAYDLCYILGAYSFLDSILISLTYAQKTCTKYFNKSICAGNLHV